MQVYEANSAETRQRFCRPNNGPVQGTASTSSDTGPLTPVPRGVSPSPIHLLRRSESS